MVDQVAFTDLCRRQLELSGVHEGESVTVLSQGDERMDYADAFLAAAQSLGAKAYHMRLPAPGASAGAWAVGASGLAANPEAVEALKRSDMLVDLVFLLFSKEQQAVQDAGTRVLSAVEPVELLARLFPTEELRERVEVGQELMRKAGSLRFTNALGTDVTYRLGRYDAITEYGYTDEPGRWDHWPSGFVFTGGDDDGVDGRIVLAPGDVLLPFNTYVQTPVEITVEHGFITDIRGTLDAQMLRSYIESFDDPRGYGMSHVGWGLNQHAQWHGLLPPAFPGGMGMEPRAVYGNVMFSIGPNNELGGPNDTPCHFDIPMRDCSLFLDDEAIVVDGDVVVPEMRPASRRS
ncbi:leucyl aminopeptidase [Actinomadura darangshiensis]|uniref:Leucyl aminopeptidase n=1 Tax=Actinomadura darangshiensis TaxID=705336 RepID=A0A4R5A0I1_9ACTN|nr:leucyl aminopeptidase [Actinomadura darangshiensis]TDD64380.1 leucyl aminopeptidase [Actinomadura darangshiensis]